MAVVSSSWTLASAFRFACASAVLRPTNLRRGLRVTDCVVDSTLGAGDLALACASMKDAVRKLTRKMMWFQILELFQKDWTQHLGAEHPSHLGALHVHLRHCYSASHLGSTSSRSHWKPSARLAKLTEIFQWPSRSSRVQLRQVALGTAVTIWATTSEHS